MKTSDALLLILAAALIIGMILTAVLGKERGKHGYGFFDGGYITVSSQESVDSRKTLTQRAQRRLLRRSHRGPQRGTTGFWGLGLDLICERVPTRNRKIKA